MARKNQVKPEDISIFRIEWAVLKNKGYSLTRACQLLGVKYERSSMTVRSYLDDDLARRQRDSARKSSARRNAPIKRANRMRKYWRCYRRLERHLHHRYLPHVFKDADSLTTSQIQDRLENTRGLERVRFSEKTIERRLSDLEWNQASGKIRGPPYLIPDSNADGLWHYSEESPGTNESEPGVES